MDRKTMKFVYDEVSKLQLENYELQKNDFRKGKDKAFRQVLTMIAQNIPVEETTIAL